MMPLEGVVTEWQGIPLEIIPGKDVAEKQQFTELVEAIYKVGITLLIGGTDARGRQAFTPGDLKAEPKDASEDWLFNPGNQPHINYLCRIDEKGMPFVKRYGVVPFKEAFTTFCTREINAQKRSIAERIRKAHDETFTNPFQSNHPWQELYDRVKFRKKLYDATICLIGLHQAEASTFWNLSSPLKFAINCCRRMVSLTECSGRVDVEKPHERQLFPIFGSIKIGEIEHTITTETIPLPGPLDSSQAFKLTLSREGLEIDSLCFKRSSAQGELECHCNQHITLRENQRNALLHMAMEVFSREKEAIMKIDFATVFVLVGQSPCERRVLDLTVQKIQVEGEVHFHVEEGGVLTEFLSPKGISYTEVFKQPGGRCLLGDAALPILPKCCANPEPTNLEAACL